MRPPLLNVAAAVAPRPATFDEMVTARWLDPLFAADGGAVWTLSTLAVAAVCGWFAFRSARLRARRHLAVWTTVGAALGPLGLARFQLSLETLLHGTLDDVMPGSPPLLKGIFFAGVLLADRTIAKVGHEYGHVSVFNRAGYEDFLLTVGNQDPEPLTFREVFINSLVPQRHMSVQLEEDEAQDAMTRFTGREFEEFTAITFAGGLNQEQVHLNLFRERVFRHQFGFFDTASYLIESASTLAYTGSEDGDISGYVESLERAGFSSSISRVKAVSLVRFLSGTAVSAGIGFYRAMTEDRFDAFLPERGQPPDVRTPDADRGRTERQCLEDIRAAAHAAVDQHLDPRLHGVHDLGQLNIVDAGDLIATPSLVETRTRVCPRENNVRCRPGAIALGTCRPEERDQRCADGTADVQRASVARNQHTRTARESKEIDDRRRGRGEGCTVRRGCDPLCQRLLSWSPEHKRTQP